MACTGLAASERAVPCCCRAKCLPPAQMWGHRRASQHPTRCEITCHGRKQPSPVHGLPWEPAARKGCRCARASPAGTARDVTPLPICRIALSTA